MDIADKGRENRATFAVKRRGYELQKRRVPDSRASDYGTFQIVDPITGFRVFAERATGRGYGLSFVSVETRCADDTLRRKVKPSRKTNSGGAS